jgi:hypothetical protein
MCRRGSSYNEILVKNLTKYVFKLTSKRICLKHYGPVYRKRINFNARLIHEFKTGPMYIKFLATKIDWIKVFKMT